VNTFLFYVFGIVAEIQINWRNYKNNIRYTLFLILIYSTATWGQIDSLWELKEKGIITVDQWYDLKLKSGYISSEASGCVQYTGQIDINSEHYKSLKIKSALIFYISDKH